MKRMFLVFSHDHTDVQEQEARNTLNCEELISMPDDLQNLWSNVDPSIDDISLIAGQIVSWLESNSSAEDYVLVEGDFGMTFTVADWALSNGRVPVYSTTERCYSSNEGIDGARTNVHVFRHVQFRKYTKLT